MQEKEVCKKSIKTVDIKDNPLIMLIDELGNFHFSGYGFLSYFDIDRVLNFLGEIRKENETGLTKYSNQLRLSFKNDSILFCWLSYDSCSSDTRLYIDKSLLPDLLLLINKTKNDFSQIHKERELERLKSEKERYEIKLNEIDEEIKRNGI